MCIRDRYQYVYFCLDGLPGCVFDDEGEVNIINVVASSSEGVPVNIIEDELTKGNCFVAQFFTDQFSFCGPLGFTITISFSNVYGDVMFQTIYGEIDYCCAYTPPIIINPGPDPENDPENPDNPVLFRSVYPEDDGSITIIADLDSNMENDCLLYTSPSPRDATLSRMPSSA